MLKVLAAAAVAVGLSGVPAFASDAGQYSPFPSVTIRVVGTLQTERQLSKTTVAVKNSGAKPVTAYVDCTILDMTGEIVGTGSGVAQVVPPGGEVGTEVLGETTRAVKANCRVTDVDEDVP